MLLFFSTLKFAKSKELFKRAKIAWEGKEEPKKSKKNNQNNKNTNIVSVSQPISNGVLPPTVPTHKPQNGNGYVEQFQQMTAPQPSSPPQQVQQGFQGQPQPQQQCPCKMNL